MRPPFRAWAPGRVNLIGEHTDYSGGLVLPVAIQYGTTVTVERVQDTIELVSEARGRAAPFAADGSGPRPSRYQVPAWERYAQELAAELGALGRPAVGLAGTIASDLPIGAGLSSSAALSVSVGLALCAVAGFELEPLELALACRRAESRAIGVEVGILDQAASVLGREGNAVLIDTATLEHRRVPVPPDAAFVVIDSGIAHSHESSGYADRRRELEAGLPRRVRHVRTENERVRAFVAALEDGDLAECGALLLQSHASLRDDYEVSVHETDLLVELAHEAGALGARIVGGGFGGSVLALTETEQADELAASVSEAYRAHTGAAAQTLIAHASRGAEVTA